MTQPQVTYLNAPSGWRAWRMDDTGNCYAIPGAPKWLPHGMLYADSPEELVDKIVATDEAIAEGIARRFEATTAGSGDVLAPQWRSRATASGWFPPAA
ncbi:hypothetical protein HNR23_000778 [Nocardiopsis mwathae]|uniref:Uncharacterized protein n=1 Tax=Nocardiopsis mwathae TaxID=1472723 RepID=A0A7X0D3Z5_9ACTN|nr:hypothetical protein [Nocardiopsis mwathae]